MAAWTSLAALSTGRSMSNWMTIEVLPVLLVLVISVTPGISPRRRSRGAAMDGGHGFGVGAGAAGEDDDGGDVDAGQGGDRQEARGDEAAEQQADGEQDGGDGAADERFGQIHCYSAGATIPERQRRARARSKAR